jgi:hypothetical protein
MLIVPSGGGGQPLPKTLNEMEAELQALQKENFDLKMTIFYQKARACVCVGGISELRQARHFQASRQTAHARPFLFPTGGAGAAAGLRGTR